MGIAVLLGGGEEDRYAVLHAIALAKRIGEVIHGVRQEAPVAASTSDAPENRNAGQTLLLQLADSAGVVVRCHVVAGKEQTDLIELLREQRIFCLIVGAKDEAAGQRAEKRMQALRRAIASDRRWSIGSFWAMVTGPWSEEAMAAAMDELPAGCREIIEKGGRKL